MLSGLSFGFLLIGHIYYCTGRLDKNFFTDGILYFIVTVTMAGFVGAAAAYHEEITEMFIYSCAWTLNYCLLGLLIYADLLRFTIKDDGASRSLEYPPSFYTNLRKSFTKPGIMLAIGSFFIILQFLITTTWTVHDSYYTQIGISVPVSCCLLIWIIFSTWHIGSRNYDWRESSSLAVVLGIYVNTMILVIILTRIFKWIYEKCKDCCCSEKKGDKDSPIRVEMIPSLSDQLGNDANVIMVKESDINQPSYGGSGVQVSH